MSKHKKDNEQTDDIEIISDESEEQRSIGKDVQTLKQELKQVQEERSTYLEGWQRAKADLINFKRSSEEETRGAFTRGAAALIQDLLPVLDSFDMAFANKEAWEAAPKNWRDGVLYIHQQLLSVLRDRGVEPFSPEGEHFNPHEHESVGTVAVEKSEDEGIITSVMQKGYRLQGTVIRPARVTVGAHEK